MVYVVFTFLCVVVYSCITYIFGACVVRIRNGFLFLVQVMPSMQSVEIFRNLPYSHVKVNLVGLALITFLYKTLELVYITQNFVLVIRIQISILNCPALYECWNSTDWQEVGCLGERHGMVNWLWRGVRWLQTDVKHSVKDFIGKDILFIIKLIFE